MNESNGKGWKRPGMRASDYSLSADHNHDYRIYAAAEDHYGKGPRGYRRSDERIKEEVSEALYWHPDVDASDIELMVQDGLVFLTGSVDSRHAKRMAERAIENISGIEDIQNQLIIKPTIDLDSDKLITRGDEGLFTQETIRR